MNCDECKWYNWYYDYCRKWKSKIDPREVHNCYEKRDTPVSDAMKKMRTNLKQTEVFR